MILICVLRLGMVTKMCGIPEYDVGLLHDFAIDVSGKAVIGSIALLTVFVFSRMVGHYEEISRGERVGSAVA